MDAHREAFEILGGRYEVSVLEPSPPAQGEAPWYADDPVAPRPTPAGMRTVSPIGNGDLTWTDVSQGDPRLQEWCRERWLGPFKQLTEMPREHVRTREALHQLAEWVLAPARYRVNGKIGLRFTFHGFGTPFFGSDVQVRVEGTELVVQEGPAERRAPISTISEAAGFVGIEPSPPSDVYTPATSPNLDGHLEIDEQAALALSDWFGFADNVLEVFRCRASDREQTRVQIWPEHFDIAVVLGSDDDGARASYGASPGDENHELPYLYVAPWETPSGKDRFWNAAHFPGAEMGYPEILAATDQKAAAFDFFEQGRRRLQEK